MKCCNLLAQIQQQGRESNEGAASFLRLLGNRVDVMCEGKGAGFPGSWKDELDDLCPDFNTSITLFC